MNKNPFKKASCFYHGNWQANLKILWKCKGSRIAKVVEQEWNCTTCFFHNYSNLVSLSSKALGTQTGKNTNIFPCK